MDGSMFRISKTEIAFFSFTIPLTIIGAYEGICHLVGWIAHHLHVSWN